MKRLLFFIFIFTTLLHSQFIREPIFNEVTYVETFGNPNNEAVVFIHGLGNEASTIWQDSVEVLKNNYYVMIFDLPGFGKSDKSNQLYSPTKYAKFINTLVDNFIDRPFHLVGHSMGASIALKYTSLYEERVKSLMLIDAAAILNRSAYSKFLVKYKVKTVVQNDKISNFIAKLPGTLEDVLPLDLDLILNRKLTRKFLLRSNPNTIAAMALVQENFSSIPRNINVPTFILWGERDDVAPLRTGYVLDFLIPNTNFKVLKNSKHVPIIDNKDKYLSFLNKHLKNHNYKKSKFDNNSKPINKKIEKKKNRVISGYFKTLKIFDSKNIIIKDAKIEELIIINSDVKILKSEILLKNRSLIQGTNLEITASSLNAEKSINVSNSTIDLAGLNINTGVELFKNIDKENSTKILYSLCLLNGNNIHGVKKYK